MSTQSFRVLVVQSKITEAERVCGMLTHHGSGHLACFGSRLSDAGKRLQHERFDIVVLYQQSPDRSGFDILARLRQKARDVPIVVLTDSNDEQLRIAVVDLGADDFVIKDGATGDSLVRSLCRVIERSQIARALRARDAEAAQVSRVLTLGAMAAALSHELKQPITAIATYAEATIKRLDVSGARTERLIDNLRAIAQQAAHVDQILGGIRGYIGQSRLKRELVAVEDLIRHAVRLIEVKSHDLDVEVTVSVGANLPKVFCDPLQMQQLLCNLLDNAIDAAAYDSGNSRFVCVSAAQCAKQQIELRVEDNGPGIAPEIVESMFQPFATTKPEGMGLGLAISRAVVEAHHGDLAARTNDQGGATFSVRLPVAGCDEGGEAPQPHQTAGLVEANR